MQTKPQPQPSTSNGGINPTSAFQSRNLGAGRPHATHMCRALLNTGNNPICAYFSSIWHTSGNCTSQLNDSREETRSIPQDLHSQGPYREQIPKIQDYHKEINCILWISDQLGTHILHKKIYNSFTGIIAQIESQNPIGPESGPKGLETDDSTPTFDTTKCYQGEITFRNQGTSPMLPEHADPVERQTNWVNTQKGTSSMQTGAPSISNTQSGAQTMRTLPPQPNTGKGGKKKTSKILKLNHKYSHGINPTSASQSRNLGIGRPHVQCSACGGYDHFRQDCHQDNFCTRFRTRSHATHMCRAPLNTGNNPICVYCGST